MKFDAGGGDFAIIMILFMLLVICVFVGLAGLGAESGYAMPTVQPIWPPHNAF